MALPLQQHQIEIEQNLKAWKRKPLLRAVYAGFYREIRKQLILTRPGRIVEIGSGIGNLRQEIPDAVCTDLFPNPWVDLTCDGYELPFRDGALSHLLLIDVFHHLEAPAAFLQEAQRVLVDRGRLILLEPYISSFSFPVYGLCHHEPIAWRQPISSARHFPRPRPYYAAQGNATRTFFAQRPPDWLTSWLLIHKQVLAGLTYVLSGGFSGPSLLPARCCSALAWLDRQLSRWPRLFGVRCLVCLEKPGQS
jgi:SAM-dependent methyltransferase